MLNRTRMPHTHRVILVRHAEPHVEPDGDPDQWTLTAAGRAAATRLAALALFDRAAGYYAGPAPKLVETLAPVAAARGQSVQTMPNFAESRSRDWLEPDQFLDTVRCFFADPGSPPAPGWETATSAALRVEAGVDTLRATHQPVVHPGHVLPGTFAVASGGRALIVYLARLTGLDADSTFALWRSLRLPDLAVVELSSSAAPRVVIPFGVLAV